MRVVTVGLNHKTAPVRVREAVAVSDDQAPAMLGTVVSDSVEEAAVLSTCNRTELYIAAESAPAAEAAGLRLFEALSVDGDVRRALYVKADGAAARHLFSVSAGLDSLIVGESQVLGQVRRTYDIARAAGTAGPYLAQLFNQAVRVGKRVRAETPIGQGAASVSYAAVELAKKIFDDLGGKCALLVGAGKMAEMAAKNLADQGVSSIFVVNRSVEHAERLAQSVGGESAELSALPRLLAHADIAITSTGSRSALLTRRDVATVMRRRKGRPLFLIDIAVPRDVVPEAGDLDGVFLYNIDDLKGVVDANIAERRRYMGDAEKIVAEEVARFAAWMDERRAAPVIKALRQKVYETAEAEVARVLRRLDHLSEKEKEQIRALSRSIAGKILHEPTLKIKDAVGSGNHKEVFELVGDLFDLDIDREAERAEGSRIDTAHEAGPESGRAEVRLAGFGRPTVEERPAW